jgi:hypothetical protein
VIEPSENACVSASGGLVAERRVDSVGAIGITRKSAACTGSRQIACRKRRASAADELAPVARLRALISVRAVIVF